MHSTFYENKDSLSLLLYVVLAVFILYRARGLSNILRFSLRYFKMGYTNVKLKKLDEEWHNIQLFKIINNINVTNIKDAIIIQKKLEPRSFKTISFCIY